MENTSNENKNSIESNDIDFKINNPFNKISNTVSDFYRSVGDWKDNQVDRFIDFLKNTNAVVSSFPIELKHTGSYPIPNFIKSMDYSSSRHKQHGNDACFTVKNFGKPCTAKPYARFDEGGLGFLPPTLPRF